MKQSALVFDVYLGDPDQDDGRVVFVLPYEDNYSMIGATNVLIEGDPKKAAASEDEVHYLLAPVNRYMTTELRETDIVWKFSGVRPHYDDDAKSASKVTRNYHLAPADCEKAAAMIEALL